MYFYVNLTIFIVPWVDSQAFDLKAKSFFDNFANVHRFALVWIIKLDLQLWSLLPG